MLVCMCCGGGGQRGACGCACACMLKYVNAPLAFLVIIFILVTQKNCQLEINIDGHIELEMILV